MSLKRATKSVARVAAYVRVSSATQNAKMQRDEIERVCASRGVDVDVWFEEKMSARHVKRPVLDHVRQLAREGHIQTLYVWRLDRLVRSGARDALDLVAELEAHGCTLVTISDPFDLRGPMAEMFLMVSAWFSKTELAVITERREATRATVLAAGGTWGRPKRAVPTATVQRAREMRLEGRSIRYISSALKVPRATLARRLKSKPRTPAQKTIKNTPNRKVQPPASH